MRSTLFYIPHADPWLHIPLFGFGWLLVVWGIAGAALLIWLIRRHGWGEESRGYIPVLLVLGAAIVWVAPMLEEATSAGDVLGVPIRGYGVMLLMGVVCGVSLVAQQARRMGLDPDIIFSLAFWMFVAGIVGARLFYVIEYWDQFSRPTTRDTLIEIFRLTEGGLVVYGSLIGALIAYVIFLRRQQLPVLAIGDLIVLGMLLGLALGRVGCLLNGCCYGGTCGNSPLAVTFPPGSPPFIDQIEQGALMGMQIEHPDTSETNRLFRWLAKTFLGKNLDHPDKNQLSVVRQVTPGSLADRQHVKPGDKVLGIQLPTEDELKRMRSGQRVDDALITVVMVDGRRISWPLKQLPTRSKRIYPTQILSSLNALAILWFLWSYYPFRRRDGEVLAFGLMIYAITRFLLEIIRSDEPGMLPTNFKYTISQIVSSVLVVLIIALWVYVLSQPKGSVLPPSGSIVKNP